MKNLIYYLLILTTICSYSQDTLSCYRTKVYYSEDHILSNKEVKEILSTNTEASKLYSIAKTKQITGNIFLATGFLTAASKYIFQKKNKYDFSTYPTTTTTYNNNILLYIGSGLMIVSIPIIIGHEKKIKKAVSLVNKDIRAIKTGLNKTSTTIIATTNGVGISIKF